MGMSFHLSISSSVKENNCYIFYILYFSIMIYVNCYIFNCYNKFYSFCRSEFVYWLTFAFFWFLPNRNLLICSFSFLTGPRLPILLFVMLKVVAVLLLSVDFMGLTYVSFYLFFIVFRIAISAFKDSSLSCWR